MKTMKKILLVPAAALVSGLCLAQEVGRVISSTPINQQVGVPRQVCSTEQVAVQPPKSGAGAVIGAIAGGAMGNAVGGGGGKAAATMIGIMGGAMIGDRVEGAPLAHYQNLQRCTTQTFYENRTVAYNVVYEYAGKQFSVQMPRDPGPTVTLQISPVDAGTVSAPPLTSSYPQTYDEQPTPVLVAPVVYPRYYAQPYFYPSIRFEQNYWVEGGHHRGGHRR
jgi:uncharacterized protein YcfJ